MKKFLFAVRKFLEHGVTNVIGGLLLLVFAWHCAYQIGFDVDLYSLFVGVFCFVGVDRYIYGLEKLLHKIKD